MNYDRWVWYFAALGSILLPILATAYFVERECQRDLEFQRAAPSSLSELIVGTKPVKCWFD
jgi:hypothetical protein